MDLFFTEKGNWDIGWTYKICEPGPECFEVCADFCVLELGTSVEGLGTVENI